MYSAENIIVFKAINLGIDNIEKHNIILSTLLPLNIINPPLNNGSNFK